MNVALNSTASSLDERRALLARQLKLAMTEDHLPLSFAQQRLWFLDQLEPNSPLYNVATTVRIAGQLDFNCLKQAFCCIVERHEALRTRFIAPDGSPYQVVDAGVSVPLDLVDLTGLPDSEREQRAEKIIRDEINRPFDLSSELLIRPYLIRLAPEEHLLILVVHHIVSDEWSLKILFRELRALYEAHLRGEPAGVPELPVQYADFAQWQRDWARGPVLKEQLAYWKRQLSGLEQTTALLPDYGRGSHPTFRGANCSRLLEPRLCAEVQRCATQAGVTPFMFLLTAFNALLQRYTRLEDITVGSPIACRTRPEVENLIGFFVNTLPLRTNVAGDPSFRELLGRVRETTLGAFANQDLPFEKLVEELQPERSRAHMPFTRIMFVVQSDPLIQMQMAGLQLNFKDVEADTAKFDLTFTLQILPEGLLAKAEFDTGILEAPTVGRLLEHFEILLRDIVTRPEARISELDILSEAEHRLVVHTWNSTQTNYPRHKCVHQLFQAQAELTPSATAVSLGDKSITYQELNERSNQLAHYLLRFGVAPDVPVAICTRRSIEFIVGMLAVLKAGGAYVPLDPSYPPAALRVMLEDVGAPVILTEQALLAHLPGISARMICFDADWELAARETRSNPTSSATAANLAYIMYTSGSTGRPKGVAVPHRAVNRLVLNTNYVRLDHTDRIAQVSNVAFDAATFEVWGALLNGAQLVIVTRDVALSPEEFARELQIQQITAMFLTTALFNLLASDAPGAFKSVRTLIVGGEALDPKWVRSVLKLHPPARLLNGYGPTENTTFTCCHEIRDLPEGAASVPIGRPIANTSVFILGPGMRPAPVGVPGELYVGGDGLACQYWHAAELTTQKFIPAPPQLAHNPARSGQRANAAEVSPCVEREPVLYRTGDLGRWLPDGTIEFLGRADNQVKVRGFRIELGEIETVLGGHPQVRECAIKVVGNSTRTKRLIAYVAPEKSDKCTPATLRDFLSDKLPAHMVPAAFVFLPKMPLTPNGKVDRNALPEPDQARPELQKQYVPASNETQRRLVEIWETVLSVRPIGIEDRFFELGGHSLLAVRVVAQIEKTFGRKLRLSTIFRAQTIQELAALIDQPETKDLAIESSSLVDIQASGKRRRLFLVHGAGGGMFWGYVNLSRELGPDQPVCGFKSRGLDGAEEYDSIQEMAACYVRDMRKVQPRGPYFLGGYCFGGNVAFEMARQIEAAGEKVGLLALMNCAPPNSRYTRVPWTPVWGLRLLANLLYWARYFLSWSGSQRREFFRWKWGVLLRKLRGRHGNASGGLSKVDVGNLVDLSSYTPEQQKVWEAHIRALIGFRPKPYGGRVHLFRSPGHPLWCSFDPDYGWADLARGGVEVCIVPGAHEKILEPPCVAELADRLSAYLGAEGDATPAKPTAKALACFKGVLLRASLLWLGGESEQVVETAGPFLEPLTLGMLFEKLKDLPRGEATLLPLNDKRGKSGSAQESSLNLPHSLSDQLRAFASQQGVPVLLLLLAALKLLFKKYSALGRAAMVYESDATDLDQRLGCTIHQLMLDQPLADETSFEQLVTSMRQSAEKNGIVAELEDDGIPDGTEVPLFQLSLESANPANYSNGSHNSPMIFGLFGIKVATRISLRLRYDTDHFSNASADELWTHLLPLLSRAIADPRSSAVRHSLLSQEAERELVRQWNGEELPIESEGNWVLQFQGRVAAQPAATALVFGANSLTYSQVNERANRLAARLRALGAGPETLVAVCLERTAEQIITLIATWKSGAAYVPLDPLYPTERLEYMLKDSGAKVLVTKKHLWRQKALPAVSDMCLDLDDPSEQRRILASPATNPSNPASKDDLAYVIYTSGSTGTPKGVAVTQRAALNHSLATIRAYGLKESDRVLQFAPISFDVSVEEIFPTMMAGSSLVLRTNDSVSSVDDFLNFISAEEISVVNLPTAFWHELVEHLPKHALPPALRLVIIGGEKASDDLFRRWAQHIGEKVKLINGYGPTEATVTSTIYEANPKERFLPIGRPLPNIKIAVLDPDMQPVPVGFIGELMIGGACLARGYLNQPDLTSERFVQNPLLASGLNCDRLYRTGDLVRQRKDGVLEFIGRADEQVKIRGFRIELGEIEAAARAYPMVQDAVAVVREDVPGRKRLVCYFVPRHPTAQSVSPLLAWMKTRLPAHMLPSAFVPIPKIPLNPAGKVDRRALPKPNHTRPDLDQAFVAPREPLEETIAAIWSEALGIDRVGAFDNFFDLGGHSLLATRIIASLRDKLQLEVPITALFAEPTLAGFCESLKEHQRARPLVPAEAEYLPLTAAQKRTWFLDQFNPEQSPYNLPLAIRLEGPLNHEALQASLSALSRRHEALCAMFPVINGEPVQYLYRRDEVPVTVIDLTHIPEPEREARANAIASLEARRPHAVESPMFRALLFRLDTEKHWLLLVLHEIAADADSLGIISSELPLFYAGACSGEPVELTGIDAGYEQWSRTVEASDPADLAWWKDRLQGAPALLELPTDFVRPALRSDLGARRAFQIRPEIAANIAQYCRTTGCHQESVLLAALAAVLHRYSNSTDVVIGSTHSNRDSGRHKNIVGRLSNLIPLRCDLGGDPSFGTLVRAIQQTGDEARAHSVSFANLLEELYPSRNTSHTPVFQVMFRFGEQPLEPKEAAALRFVPFSIDNGTSKYDLSLLITPTGTGYEGWLEYSSSLFKASRIDRLAGHLETLLGGGLANPETPVSRLPLLTERESRQIQQWNRTAKEYPAGKTLWNLFEEQVARTPESTAVISGPNRLTFQDLHRRVLTLSGHLLRQGIGRGDLVAICIERSWEMLAAILATLQAGAAYVPIDPDYPHDRVAFMLEDARVSLLVTQRNLASRLPSTDALQLLVDDVDWSVADQVNGTNAAATGQPNDLAYVIYTSGSTGKPKGVALEHRNAVAFVAWAKEVFTPAELSGVLASTSICFDLSIFEMFVPLCTGGTVVLAKNALALADLPAAHEVTLINTVPSAIRELLRVQGVPPSVRVVNLAGEPLPAQLVDQIYAQTKASKVYDLYGPTETTTYSTFALRRPGEPATIGKPLTNEHVYLLDNTRQLVPVGNPGEVYIGGAGVARGYLNRPELTTERFVPDPFNPSTRVYRTGDLARWREDGNLEYLGRIDHQVKIRGFRIELGEIETALKSHAAVSEAVVVAQEHETAGKRLVAYVATDRRTDQMRQELKQLLATRLPEYMVPSVFVLLQELPKTPNGKIDRKALPTPESGRSAPAATYTAPTTSVEKRLVAIWEEVLRVKQIGVEDNFFDIGGQSLLAIQITSRIRQVFKVELPLFSLFDAPTVRALADGLESGKWGTAQSVAPDLKPVPRGDSIPLSFVQERLWFLEQLHPGLDAYHMPAALKLRGALDAPALEKALNRVIARHEVLRTSFRYSDSEGLQQIIAPDLQLRLPVVDLSGRPEEERDRIAAQLTDEFTGQPFDLASGPLLRANLIRIHGDEHILVVVMHHTISDGWSQGLFFQELASLYEAQVTANAPTALPELPVQYADFAQWQREWVRGEVLERELRFWKERLTNAPPQIDLPAETVPGTPNVLGKRHLRLSPEKTRAVHNFCQANSLTPFVLLLSALGVTLQKWTGQKDLVIGTVVAGRSRKEIENLIGCFMNFLPIRLKINGAETCRELLSRARTSVLEAQLHQDCPFERIVQAVNPSRERDQNPLYNVALLLQNFPGEIFPCPGLRTETVPASLKTPLLDLRFEAEELGEELTVGCEYRGDMFSPGTIDQLLGSIGQVLGEFMTDASTPVHRVQISTGLEQQAKASREAAPVNTVAIAATFTAEPVEEALRYWFGQLDMKGDVEFAPYNQVFQQLLDPSSTLRRNTHGLNVLLLRIEDWKTASRSQEDRGRRGLEETAGEFLTAMRAAAVPESAPWLVCICPASTSAMDATEVSSTIQKIEEHLARELLTLPGVHVLPSDALRRMYPVEDYLDAAAEELGHVPYTPVFFTALATAIARKFQALKRAQPKVIVLDCDNTLWAGVCGEDGASGIRLEEPWMALQQFMLRQQNTGKLLCLCSKNNEEDVWQVFDSRSEMPLRREHLAAWRLNWLPKSQNLRSLAAELNLGLDSIVFIDDNPVECAEVEANCPEVQTLLLPEQPEQFASFLEHCWIFDTLTLTGEDRQRTEMYRQNREREELRARSSGLAEFLAGLQLRVEIAPLVPASLARAAQLTQRTNQFNCTTRRRTEAEIQALLDDKEIFTVKVSDRFGDYGLVGLMIFQVLEDSIDVDTFLLSCRVLGRGVEYRMVRQLGEIARDRGLHWVDLRFEATAKNKPALTFLETVGGKFKQPLNGGSVFRLPARVAAEAELNPDVSTPLMAETATAKPSASPKPAPGKFRRCREIALECSSALAIHERIQAKVSGSSARKTLEYSAPLTPLQIRLCELWQKLLRVERVGIRDNFFELGGHSLLAVRLFSEIARLTHRKLPLITLFQAPTIEKLCEALEQNTGSGHSLLVPIQPRGSQPPLFLVHGAGGDVLWGYANLAKHLPEDRPVYGIKSRGQVGLEEPATLEEMARCYVEALREFQPEGPYYLGGYCFGGNVAFEMARQLKSKGHEVALVTLIDSSPSNVGYEQVTWWHPAFPYRFARNLSYWIEDFVALKSQEKRNFFARKLRAFGRKFTARFGGKRNGSVDLEEVINLSHFPEHELRLWKAHLEALVQHVDREYSGRVTLLRTRGQPLFCSLAEDFCWSKLLPGGVDVRRIPGSHENIFIEPNVKALAGELADCLSLAMARHQTHTKEESLSGA